MRTAIVVVALVVGFASAHADAPRATAVGFDHLVHDRDVIVGGGDALACARCHVLDKGRLVGRPEHAACFGACHGPAPARPSLGAKPALGDRAKVCEACHAEAALVAPFKGKLAAHYPPYTIDRDFNLGFGHKQHAAAACTDCHAPDTRSRVTPHARCVACHAKTMDRCAGCHPPAIGKPQPPELSALHDTVTTAFSHGKHAQRGAKGRECTTCHAGIRATDDSELPRPTVADCAVAGCHDGKAAFGTTVACVRCHDREPTERFKVSRPTTRFTHGGSHAAIVASAACGTCHPIAGGEVAIAGHAACASCHEEDFGTREPQICGACHYATEPWRHLKPDRGPAERTEFGATLDHGKHTSACASCHSLRTQTAQLRPPRGHRACSTAGCHATTTGPAPHLTDCAGCHRQGLAAAREAARTVAAWSVRAAFDHAAHEHGKDGAAVSCTGCHLDLAARDVVAMPAPPKVTCEPCHDGQTAFSLTGTTCRRCHTPERTR